MGGMPGGGGGPGGSLPPQVIQALLSALAQNPQYAPMAATLQGTAGAAPAGPVGAGAGQPLGQGPMGAPVAQLGSMAPPTIAQNVHPSQVIYGPGASGGTSASAPTAHAAQQATNQQSTWQQDFINHVGQTTGQYVNPNTIGLTSQQQANSWLAQNGFSQMPASSYSTDQYTGGLY